MMPAQPSHISIIPNVTSFEVLLDVDDTLEIVNFDTTTGKAVKVFNETALQILQAYGVRRGCLLTAMEFAINKYTYPIRYELKVHMQTNYGITIEKVYTTLDQQFIEYSKQNKLRPLAPGDVYDLFIRPIEEIIFVLHQDPNLSSTTVGEYIQQQEMIVQCRSNIAYLELLEQPQKPLDEITTQLSGCDANSLEQHIKFLFKQAQQKAGDTIAFLTQDEKPISYMSVAYTLTTEIKTYLYQAGNSKPTLADYIQYLQIQLIIYEQKLQFYSQGLPKHINDLLNEWLILRTRNQNIQGMIDSIIEPGNDKGNVYQIVVQHRADNGLADQRITVFIDDSPRNLKAVAEAHSKLYLDHRVTQPMIVLKPPRHEKFEPHNTTDPLLFKTIWQNAILHQHKPNPNHSRPLVYDATNQMAIANDCEHYAIQLNNDCETMRNPADAVALLERAYFYTQSVTIQKTILNNLQKAYSDARKNHAVGTLNSEAKISTSLPVFLLIELEMDIARIASKVAQQSFLFLLYSTPARCIDILNCMTKLATLMYAVEDNGFTELQIRYQAAHQAVEAFVIEIVKKAPTELANIEEIIVEAELSKNTLANSDATMIRMLSSMLDKHRPAPIKLPRPEAAKETESSPAP